MRIDLICVGKMGEDLWPAYRHYRDLLQSYTKIGLQEVRETPLSQGHDRVRESEGEKIGRHLRGSACKIALDPGGRQMTSPQLSRFLAKQKLHGRSHFQFILGGAVGLHGSVLEAVELRWSLSRLTFPHQLARCMVMEQLYRAMRIERGEPYHY